MEDPANKADEDNEIASVSTYKKQNNTISRSQSSLKSTPSKTITGVSTHSSGKSAESSV